MTTRANAPSTRLPLPYGGDGGGSAEGAEGAGDVELGGISLATVRVVGEEAVAGAGGGDKSTADAPADADYDEENDDDENEERSALLHPLNDSTEKLASSSSGVLDHDEGRRRRRCVERILGVLSTGKGECVMFFATFIYALQNVVAKTVERRVPPLQVVFIRSLLSGAITCATIYQRVHAHNRRVVAKDAIAVCVQFQTGRTTVAESARRMARHIAEQWKEEEKEDNQ